MAAPLGRRHPNVFPIPVFYPSQEEELFPFNLDEFVTVDEVVEEVESPVTPRRNPPRGKRKEGPKPNPSEPATKKRKGKSGGASSAEGELSFVTLDEIGEEEDAPVPPPGADPQGLVVVDEVVEEEELSEAVKDPQALVTLDEISEQEEPGSHRDGARPEFEERDLKAEPLVTVDEIGEVEELPLNEPAELSAEEGKANPGDCAASQVPDDPSALVTVDEIQEDNEDNPLVTLDEVNEDEDDFLADFNHLKEELNFVTVDEVGDEEEENAFPGKNPPEDEDDEDIVAVAGPEEMGILGDTNPEEEMAEISKPKGEEPQGQVEVEPTWAGGRCPHPCPSGPLGCPSQPKPFHDSVIPRFRHSTIPSFHDSMPTCISVSSSSAGIRRCRTKVSAEENDFSRHLQDAEHSQR